MQDDRGDQLTRDKPSRLKRLLPGMAIALVLAMLVILGPVCGRQWRISQVPDIGDPFPVSEVLRPIPEQENAYPLFKEAFALLEDVSVADKGEYLDEVMDGWDLTDNQLNKYLRLNRPALEKWREATEKPDYQIVPIGQVSNDPYMTELTANRDLIRWCQLEIERLTKSGRPADAFPWLRASFRCSGLVTRNGPWLDRTVGVAFFEVTARSAEEWMQHPDVTADELLRLLSIVQESARLAEKPSTTVKMEYLTSRQTYVGWSSDELKKSYAKFGRKPPPLASWDAWLAAEPEFSRRLTAHLAANHLKFVDNTRRDRPPLLSDDLFDNSMLRATPAGSLPAHKLFELLKKSYFIGAERLALLSHGLDKIDREQVTSACLQVALAAQSYYRDRGEFPRRLADLQPDYLSSLPDDPYAPRPMPVIYRRTGDEAVVYGRFTNEIDDAGTTVTYDEARGKEPRDYGIRIRIPCYPPVVAPRPSSLTEM